MMDDTSALTCLLCTQPVRTEGKPRSFPYCQHTFCYKCLDTHHLNQMRCLGSEVSTSFKLENYSNIRCPCCTEGVPISGIDLRDVPMTHPVHDLLDNVQIEMKETRAPWCHWCPTNAWSRTHRPRYHCLQCKADLCAKCFQAHDNSLDHIVVYTNTRKMKLTCKSHKHPVAFYCQQCNTLICHTCTLKRVGHLDHRIETFTSICQKQKAILKDRLKQIDALVAERKEQMAITENMLQKQQQELQRTKRDVIRNVQGLISNIKLAAEDLLRTLESRQKDIKMLHENHSLYLKTSIQQLQRLRFFVQDISQDGRETTVLLHSQDVDQHLQWFSSNTHMKSKNKEALNRMRKVPKFEFSPHITNTQVRKLGDFVVTELTETGRLPALPDGHPDALLPLASLFYESEPVAGSSPPGGLFFTSRGSLLVAEYKEKQIVTYNMVSPKKGDDVIRDKCFFPHKLTSDGSLLYVTDDYQKCIKAFDKAGKLRITTDRIFHSPSGIAVSVDKCRLVVSDILDNSISILATDGTLLKKFGKKGSSDVEFKIPEFVAVSDDDEILVSDRDNHRICVYSMKGQLLRIFGSHGSGPGQLDFPMGICTDVYGNILIADSNNHRVCRFDSKGIYIDDVLKIPRGTSVPYGMAISQDGHIAFSDKSSSKIMAYKVYNYCQ